MDFISIPDRELDLMNASCPERVYQRLSSGYITTLEAYQNVRMGEAEYLSIAFSLVGENAPSVYAPITSEERLKDLTRKFVDSEIVNPKVADFEEPLDLEEVLGDWDRG